MLCTSLKADSCEHPCGEDPLTYEELLPKLTDRSTIDFHMHMSWIRGSPHALLCSVYRPFSPSSLLAFHHNIDTVWLDCRMACFCSHIMMRMNQGLWMMTQISWLWKRTWGTPNRPKTHRSWEIFSWLLPTQRSDRLQRPK